MIIGRSLKSVTKEKITKRCAHNDCENFVFGTDRKKYCDIHNTRSFRKKRNPKKQIENNIIITVNNVDIQKKKLFCCLDGCKKEYVVFTSSDIRTYPKYCEEHRNNHKRKMFCNEKL